MRESEGIFRSAKCIIARTWHEDSLGSQKERLACASVLPTLAAGALLPEMAALEGACTTGPTALPDTMS